MRRSDYRNQRDFVPALDILELRLPLDGDPALAGPPTDIFGWIAPGTPIPQPPAQVDPIPQQPPAQQVDPFAPLPDAVAPIDPFEDPFAPPQDHLPDGPSPPESIPWFPPDGIA